MEVHLLEHEKPGQDERLERDDALGAVDGERRRLLHGCGWAEGEDPKQPIEIVAAVRHARRVGVAQQIVAPVDVEGATDRAREVGALVAPEHQRRDPRRQPRIMGGEDFAHFRVSVENDPRAPFLVRRGARHGVFEQMRQRAVADVVQESRSERLARGLLGEPVARSQVALDGAQALDEAIHHMSAADRVCESRVLGPRKRERRDAELANAP